MVRYALLGATDSGEMILAACIPSNTTFSGPLAPVMELIAGAFGGLLWPAAVMMIVILALLAVFQAHTDRAQGMLRAIVWIMIIVFGVMIVMMVVTGVYTNLNARCENPFDVNPESMGLVLLHLV